jgi:Mg-chelatase subunit ChlD
MTASCAIAFAIACGSSSATNGIDPDGGGLLGEPTEAGASSPGTFDRGGDDLGGDGGTGPSAACATDTFEARQRPLDLYVMIDSSGSMFGETRSGETKWAATQRALSAFVRGPATSDVRMALQFFPRRPPGVPMRCTTTAQCNGYGPCGNRACAGEREVVHCTFDRDCRSGPCVDLGLCAGGTGFCVWAPGARCQGAGGACMRLNEASCSRGDSCSVGDYATPAVPMVPVSTGAASLVAALEAHEPSGQTPTGPALQGALTHARAVAREHPDHSVAVVFVTDGLPTRCTPLDTRSIAAIAAGAESASPSVRTYVVGVFAPEEEREARPTLDAIASAGGSQRAVLINTSQDVGGELLTALASIRKTAVPCEYDIPQPPNGKVDYGKLNVVVAEASGERSLPKVDGEASCVSSAGVPLDAGWYYAAGRALPDGGSGDEAERRIVLCPKACEAVRERAASVRIVLGCTTIVR